MYQVVSKGKRRNVALATFFMLLGLSVSNGTGVPKIHFKHATHNFMYWLSGSPFNLTATVLSDSNLTSLYWSPPASYGPLPNRTITVHHGNVTMTTFMLSKNASLGDSGNYTLTAVNKFGQSSSQLYVVVIKNCPLPIFREVQPSNNFTAVEGYHMTVNCSFDGRDYINLPLRAWVWLPVDKKLIFLNEQPYSDSKCWVESELTCSFGTDPNSCCRFQFTIHSTPHLADNGSIFYCDNNFTDTAASVWMSVAPRPEVIGPPVNVTVTVGSRATFTCDFKASTDNKITQIHWEFNGKDLAECRRPKDRINCTVSQQSTDSNYVSSTLVVYPVQSDNAGQYSCYCSYDTSNLNVDHDTVKSIQSDHKTATLSIKSDHPPGSKLFTIIGISVSVLIVIILIIIVIMVIHCLRANHKKSHDHRDYKHPLFLYYSL